MKLNKDYIRILVALIIIVLLNSFDAAFISEASGVAEKIRKIGHIIILAAIVFTGYRYWLYASPSWMKFLWNVTHILLFIVLIVVNVLNARTHIFSTLFLDQISYMRLFFTSPVPFLISLLLARVPMFNK